MSLQLEQAWTQSKHFLNGQRQKYLPPNNVGQGGRDEELELPFYRSTATAWAPTKFEKLIFSFV